MNTIFPFALGERTTKILRFVALNCSQIEEIPTGKLVLHFKGRSVVPELSRSYRPLKEKGINETA